MNRRLFVLRCALVLAAGIDLLPVPLHAEPHLAMRSGLPCAQCHTNPTGAAWQGEVGNRLHIGGNLRISLHDTDLPENDDNRRFESERSLLYVSVDLIPQRLQFYVDERLGPQGDRKSTRLN